MNYPHIARTGMRDYARSKEQKITTVMGRKRKSLTDNLQEHRAVRALFRHGLSNRVPREIIVLQKKRTGAVYALLGDDLPGGRVIAKLCEYEKARAEQAVYETILPQLSSGAIEYFGQVAEDDRSVWLFMEDVGGHRYDTDNATHRRLAAQWFGELQVRTSREETKHVFPDRGAAFYRTFLNSIIDTVPGLFLPESQPPADSRPLERIMSQCATLDAHWQTLESFCACVPVGFAHGDCLPKNVHVRNGPGGAAIAAFDWGGAGWSPAATDLGQLALPRRGPPDALPDLDVYQHVTAAAWPRLDIATIRHLALIGQLFWSLKVVSRGLPEFSCDWKSRQDVLTDMRIYEQALVRSVNGISEFMLK
jgi:hypothetical protein